MFKNDDLVEVYTDGNNNIYLPTMVNNGTGYILEKPIEGRIIPNYVTWSDIRYINQISPAFKNGTVRFEESIEKEALETLRIKIEGNKEYYTKDRITQMILENEKVVEIVNEILEIDKLVIINRFASELVALENSNEYNISNQISTYIKARQEELRDGIKKTELPKLVIKNVKPKEKAGKGKNKDKVEEDKKEDNK